MIKGSCKIYMFLGQCLLLFHDGCVKTAVRMVLGQSEESCKKGVGFQHILFAMLKL